MMQVGKRRRKSPYNQGSTASRARLPLLAALLLVAGWAWLLTNRSSSVFVAAQYPVGFQGVQGSVKLYADAEWPQVLEEQRMAATVLALYDERSNTVLARMNGWNRIIAHEASHLFDWQSGVKDSDVQVPQCRANPAAFEFEYQLHPDAFARHAGQLDYHCQKGEVLARYRAVVYRRLCGDYALGSFGVPRMPVCQQMPAYGALTLAQALKAAAGH